METMTRWFSQMLLDDHGGLFGVAVETMAECAEWSMASVLMMIYFSIFYCANIIYPCHWLIVVCIN